MSPYDLTTTDPELANQTLHITPPTTKISIKLLYGSLGVTGAPWITVNFGLLRTECLRCRAIQVVDESKTIKEFRKNVQAFAMTHAFCEERHA